MSKVYNKSEKALNIISLIRSTASSGDERRSEVSLISLGSMILIGCSAAYLGVWELGEVTHARLLEWMWSHETWMQVNVPTGGDGARVAHELAVGWWPSLLSMYGLQSLLGPEMSLRLPFMLVGGLCVGALYQLAYDWRGSRSIALCSGALLLMTPAFSLGGRHMLSSGGLGGWFFTLATLSLLNALHSHQRWGWRLLGLGAWVMSAGSLGLIGALCPLIIWGEALRYITTQTTGERSRWVDLKRELMWLFPALALVIIIYWRSWVKRSGGVDFWSLYVTIDPLEQTYNYAEWSGFQRTLHLIGFGLFPLGAFLPVVFQTLCTRRTQSTPPVPARVNRLPLGELMTLSFILSFFSVVLLAPSGGYWGGAAALISAPFALGVALFLHEGFRDKTHTALSLLAVILLWLLIDSDLKRDPGLLLSALNGADPKGLIPELPHWRWARLLTLSAFGWIIIYHTHALSRFTQASRSLLHLRGMPRHFHPALITCSVIGGLAFLVPQVVAVIPRWVVANAFVTAPFWGRVNMGSKLIVLTLIGVLGTYWICHLSWRLWMRNRLSLESRRLMHLEWATLLSLLIITPHYLGRLPVWRFMRGLLKWMEETEQGTPHYARVILVHLWVIVMIWMLITGILMLLHHLRTRVQDARTEPHHDVTTTQSPYDEVSSYRRVTLKMRSYASRVITSRRTPLKDSDKDGTSDHDSSAIIRWIQSAHVGRVSLIIWLIAALTFHQVTLPKALSAQLSHRDLLERYQRFTSQRDQLNLYQVKQELRGFYLHNLSEVTRAQFQEKARDTQRSFFMIGRDQLSLANRHFREVTQRHLPILDDDHHQLLLASNLLLDTEEDRNPIKRAVITELPRNVQKPKEPINFEDQIELVAWRATPKVPRAGAPLKLELFWRVKRKVRSNWKVFVHIDAPGQRIHGDHDPVSGVYPMRDWQSGDLVVDEHHLTVARKIKPATFTFFTGLYRGKTRMKIKNESKEVKDKENRAKIGRLRVR